MLEDSPASLAIAARVRGLLRFHVLQEALFLRDGRLVVGDGCRKRLAGLGDADPEGTDPGGLGFHGRLGRGKLGTTLLGLPFLLTKLGVELVEGGEPGSIRPHDATDEVQPGQEVPEAVRGEQHAEVGGRPLLVHVDRAGLHLAFHVGGLARGVADAGLQRPELLVREVELRHVGSPPRLRLLDLVGEGGDLALELGTFGCLGGDLGIQLLDLAAELACLELRGAELVPELGHLVGGLRAAAPCRSRETPRLTGRSHARGQQDAGYCDHSQ